MESTGGNHDGPPASDCQRQRDRFLASVATAAAQLMDQKGLTLEAVKKIATAAEEEAVKNEWTVVIAIVDEGGNLVSLRRLDETQSGERDEA